MPPKHLIICNSDWSAQRLGAALRDEYACVRWSGEVPEARLRSVTLDGVILRSRRDAEAFARWMVESVGRQL